MTWGKPPTGVVTFEVEWTKPSRATITNHKGLKDSAARERLAQVAAAAVDHALEAGSATVTINVNAFNPLQRSSGRSEA